MNFFFKTILILTTIVAPSRELNIVGGNIDGIADFSRLHCFCDLVKQSRTFGLPNTPWVVDNQIVQLDSLGWPNTDFGVILWIDEKTPMNGTYKISFNANSLPRMNLDASSGASLANIAFDPLNKVGIADLIVTNSNHQVMMSFTNTNGGVKNLVVIRPQCDPRRPTLFTDFFIEHHKKYDTLRFMDWGHTNGNSVSKWSERTLCTRPSQSTAAGVCWEYQISLINEVKKDMWINIPYYADDDYVTNLAILLSNQLNTNSNIYVELSNEIWNWQFSQAVWNINLATSMGSNSVLNYDGINNQGYWAWRLPAKRTIEISNIFREIFGDDKMMKKVRPILSGQIAYSEGMKTALKFTNEVYGSPDKFFYGISGLNNAALLILRFLIIPSCI